jgi:hypothetical protein
MEKIYYIKKHQKDIYNALANNNLQKKPKEKVES